MKQVKGNTEIVEFVGGEVSAVYKGGLTSLEPAELKWREEQGGDLGTINVLTLDEIAEQLKDTVLITIFVEGGLSGQIYQYGNYGDGKWWQIGTTCGYA